ncbi:MAG: hypothetical protein M0027_12150 [Candidatus Dormibacteraeota bacterium]|nr:hypothetical protein [Candidatus Dormibacteraeota bacterium]
MLAILGVLGVAAAELLRTSAAQGTLADLAVVCLSVAALLALFTRGALCSLADRPSAYRVHVGRRVQQLRPTTAPDTWEPEQAMGSASRRGWRWAQIGTALTVGALVQTWFVSGTVIAGGDITPPVGTAWIGRMFAGMAWTGSNLGSINEAQQRLPWAVVVWTTHSLGGSGAVAQRVWLTGLAMGIALAASSLARALNLSPLAGVAAGLLFVFNPYLMSIGGVADVYLLTMALLAALPALVVASAKGSLPRWLGAVGLGLSGPLVGYVYANPPLVGMLIFAVMVSVPLAWARYGRAAARRSVPVVLGGVLLMIAASSYWLVPALLALREASVVTLSPLSAWTWTEGRSTVTNALWLNTAWGWKYPIYFPYASGFSQFPLVLVRLGVPSLAFLALAMPPTCLNGRKLRATGAIALGTLTVVFLSTGTNPPGNLIFNLLYHLPYGWLLREPGRFLMAAALGYGLMAGVLLDGARRFRSPSVRSRGQVRALPEIRIPSIWLGMACGAVVLTAAGTYPLWTGAIVPGPRPPFPSSHVTVPRSWNLMANWLNSSSSPPGAVLVMPPDDFYAMPYTWYYGAEGFITDLIGRHVVDPTPQSYDLVSHELLSATHLEAEAIAQGAWTEGARLLDAMDTPIVLVRGDVVANFPGRSIISPGLLSRQFRRDPLMRQVHRDGPLSVFALIGGVKAPAGFATVNTSSPDLRVLSLLPPRTALVTSPQLVGHEAVIQPPPIATWQIQGRRLITDLSVRSGWTYRVAALAPPRTPGTTSEDRPAYRTRRTRLGARLEISLPIGPSVVHDGTFTHGTWGRVGNCADFRPVVKPAFLRAAVLLHGGPAGTPALQLSANIDAACQSQTLAWHGGSLVIKMDVRSQSGAPPALCFWEQPANQCASAASLPDSRGWKVYDSVVSPSSSTKRLSLVLYAFTYVPGQLSRDDYADIVVHSLAQAPKLDVLATPTELDDRSTLHAFATGFAPGWIAPTGGRHVEIDGLTNGWIFHGSVVRLMKASYRPIRDEAPDEGALAVLTTLLAGLVGIIAWGRRRRQASGRRESPRRTST